MQELNLKLTVDEVNLILQGLGELPFRQVFKLIGKIQDQAGAQLNNHGQTTDQAPGLKLQE